ncbi:MAG: hypothetical protein HC911_15070 [Chloroflexaceae bacterium]|nr:hypothetical protein [Chloroflexaceae bacterium]
MKMVKRISTHIRSNVRLVLNAGSLVGTTGVTSILGVIYWWLAAQQFTPAAVGFGSATIAAMMLLGSVGKLGLDTLLVGELPRKPHLHAPLIVTALVVAGSVGTVLGLLFGVLAPHVASDFQPLAHSPAILLLFASGAGLTASVLVLDQAQIGLLQGRVQLERNTIFAAGKLLVLWLAGLWLAELGGMVIYAAWVAGILLSLAWMIRPSWLRYDWRTLVQPSLIRLLGPSAIAHSVFNIALQIAALALPILVTMLHSATLNASFYVAWMIASFAFTLLSALTITLYAVSADNPAMLTQRIRFTLLLSLLACIGAIVVIFPLADPLLAVFGQSYAEDAAWCLRWLLLGAFGLMIKHHYSTLCRIYQRVAHNIPLMLGAAGLELLFAGLGLWWAGLNGLAVGWALAMTLEGMVMFPAVYRALRGKHPPHLPAHDPAAAAAPRSAGLPPASAVEGRE